MPYTVLEPEQQQGEGGFTVLQPEASPIQKLNRTQLAALPQFQLESPVISERLGQIGDAAQRQWGAVKQMIGAPIQAVQQGMMALGNLPHVIHNKLGGYQPGDYGYSEPRFQPGYQPIHILPELDVPQPGEKVPGHFEDSTTIGSVSPLFPGYIGNESRTKWIPEHEEELSALGGGYNALAKFINSQVAPENALMLPLMGSSLVRAAMAAPQVAETPERMMQNAATVANPNVPVAERGAAAVQGVLDPLAAIGLGATLGRPVVGPTGVVPEMTSRGIGDLPIRTPEVPTTQTGPVGGPVALLEQGGPRTRFQVDPKGETTKLRSGIDPSDLVPAVRVAGRLLIGQRGDTHADVLRRNGVDPEAINHFSPDRVFYDTKTKQELTRNEAQQATGLPGEAAAGGLDSTELPGYEPKPDLAPGSVESRSAFAKLREGLPEGPGRAGNVQFHSGVDPLAFRKREKELRSDAFSLSIPRMMVTPGKEGSGFASVETAVDGTQLWNRAKNKHPQEAAMLEEMGVAEKIKGKKLTPQEAAKIVQEEGPRVEVRSVGKDVGRSPEKKEFDNLVHTLIDTLRPEQHEALQRYYDGKLKDEQLYDWFNKDQVPRVKRLKELQRFDLSEPSDSTHWSSIAPKSESEMPGYVELAVVKPMEMDYTQEPGSRKEVGEKFPSFHSFPPNTLAFVRGYMDKVGDKKVFHVIEVQSDWAQAQREAKQGTVDTRAGFGQNLPEPLLPHYERLALKAAVEHAKREGADAIVMQDAESAMMMEGHDRGHVAEESEFDKIPQEKGMRLHYDQTLPKILGELTGGEGEKVSLGEHRMAYENPSTTPFWADTEGGVPIKKVPRKDLIFRNEAGQPKTDVSGRMFSLEKSKAPFSLLEKDKPASRPNYLYSGVPIGEAGKTIKEFWDSTKNFLANHETLPRQLDAADNASRIGGRQKGNALRQAVPDEKDRQALTFIAEAGGNKAKLSEFKAMVSGNRKASAAVDRALESLDRLRPEAAKLGGAIKAQRDMEIANGVDTPFLENYIKHALKDESIGFLDQGTSTGVSTAFLKDRTFPNYATAIKAGREPKSLDAADLLESRVAAGLKVVNRQKWIEGARDLKVHDGSPLVVPLQRKGGKLTTPDGYTTFEAMPGVRIGVADDYVNYFHTLLDPSWMRTHTVGKVALEASSQIKHGLLLFDSYHAGRIMRRELFLSGKVAYNKALSVLEYDPKTIDAMEKAGDLSKEHADWIRENRPAANLLIKNGLNVGRLSEALYRRSGILGEWKVKGVDVNPFGRFNKWVFDKVSRGAMLQSSLLEMKKVAKDNPSWDQNKVAAVVARRMNIYYGNLMRQGTLKSETARDLSQVAFLAPQWFDSLVRTELGAAKDIGKAPVDLAKGKSVGSLGKGVGTAVLAYFVANQLINSYTKGHPTWENKEKGHKMDAWLPSVSGEGGFWLSPFSDAAEITHDYVRYGREGKNPLESTAKILSNKAAPIERFGQTLLTGEDYSGTKLHGERRIGEAAKALMPTPLPLAGLQSDIPRQEERQLYSSVGLKVEPQSSDEKRQAETEGMDLEQRGEYEAKSRKEFKARQAKLSPEKQEEGKERAMVQSREEIVKRGSELVKALPKADRQWFESRNLQSTLGYDNKVRVGGQDIRLTKPEMERLGKYTLEEITKEALPALREDYDSYGPDEEAQRTKFLSHQLSSAKLRARQRIIDELDSKTESDKKPKRFSAFDFLR